MHRGLPGSRLLSIVGGLRSDETTRLSSAGGYRRGSLPLLSPRWVPPIGRHRLMRRCLPHGRRVQRLHPGYRTPGVAFVGAYSPDAPAGSGVRTAPRAVFLPEISRASTFAQRKSFLPPSRHLLLKDSTENLTKFPQNTCKLLKNAIVFVTSVGKLVPKKWL